MSGKGVRRPVRGKRGKYANKSGALMTGKRDSKSGEQQVVKLSAIGKPQGSGGCNLPLLGGKGGAPPKKLSK